MQERRNHRLKEKEAVIQYRRQHPYSQEEKTPSFPRSIVSTCWEEESPNRQAGVVAGDVEWGAVNQQAAN